MYHTVEQMKEGENNCLYPPRFKVKCVRISKRFIKDKTITESIGIFPIIRKTTSMISVNN